MILFGKSKSYSLLDIFQTDRAAGAVNNTVAEPTGQVRTVTDTNNKLSISGGKLNFATGGAGAGDPEDYYQQITRVPGLMAIVDSISVTSSGLQFGFDDNTVTAVRTGIQFGATILSVIRAGGGISVGAYTYGSVYKIAVILRSTGAFYYVKGGTEFPNWTLIYIGDADNYNGYPKIGVAGTSSVGVCSNFRIPSSLWLPSPIVSDGFGGAFGVTDGLGHAEGIAGGLGSGGKGLSYSNTSTWSISGGKAINTPVTFGSEVLTDGGLENWTTINDLTSWVESTSGSSSVNKESTVKHGGSFSARMDVDVSNSLVQIRQQPTTVIGTWYRFSAWLRASASGKTMLMINGANSSPALDPGTTWTQYNYCNRATSTSTHDIIVKRSGATSGSIYVDDLSVVPLSFAEMFSSILTSAVDYIADVNVTMPIYNPAGLVLNLDSTSNPQNFVLAYHDGANARLEKYVNGVITIVISAAATYSAGATLRVIKSGNSYSLYYNNVQIGSTTTISDAGIVNNTKHGLFSSWSDSTLDNFVIYPRGTNGEYNSLDRF